MAWARDLVSAPRIWDILSNHHWLRLDCNTSIFTAYSVRSALEALSQEHAGILLESGNCYT
jgi:hypothetical protein